MKKNLIIIALLGVFSFLIAQSSDYLQEANYQTAKRCVELARDQLLVQNYAEAFDFVEVGLFYDESISDLWYLHALLLEVKKQEIFKQIESVQAALEKKSWLYYTAEAGRIFYAKKLLATGNMEKALSVLNEKPVLVQSDAEYLRTLALYRLHEIEKARESISNARSLFPNDTRFPLLFFQNERLTKDWNDESFNAVLNALLPMIDRWKAQEPNLLLYASYFVEEENALRYLKEYRLSEKKDLLYILAFLEHGLFTEEQAIQELFKGAENQISSALFFEAISLLQSPQSFALFAEKLEDFSGQLNFDTNNDAIDDFFVRYKHGRPFIISYDHNADNDLNWIIECDYGLAEKSMNYIDGYELYFSRYPFVGSLSTLQTDKDFIEMQFVDGQLFWEPYVMELVSITDDLVFYLPVLQKENRFPEFESLRQNAYEVAIIPKDNEHKKIRFNMQNNLVHTALYSLDDRPYAYAFFENGILQFRNVDKDGNGSYETTEFYNFLSPNSANQDSKSLYKELFSSFEMPLGYYLSQVLIDTNENGIPDFRQRYFLDGSQETAWDQDEKGEWDLRYEKRIENSALVEKIFFINPQNNTEVEITLEDGIPLQARYANEVKKITKEKDFPFYWLGQSSHTRHALRAYTELVKMNTQGLRILIDDYDLQGYRMLAIKIDNFYFGELIEESLF